MDVSRAGLIVAVGMALCGGARAADAGHGSGYDEPRRTIVSKAPAFFFKVALGTRSLDQARSDMAVAIATLDRNGKGSLDADDARTSDLVRMTELRVAKVVALLEYDRDNAGRVTRADVEASLRSRVSPGTGDRQVSERVAAVMALDLDRDGAIDFDEMRHLTVADTMNWTEGPVQQVLRAYGPGPVPDATVTSGFDAFLSALDVDGDGTLSPAERMMAAPYDAAARKDVSYRPPAER